jgi:hypothetical protein
MTLTLGKKLKYTIHLAGPNPRKDVLQLENPIAWKAGHWHSVMINLKSLLKSRVEEAALEELMTNLVEAKKKSDAEPIELLLKRPITAFYLRQRNPERILPLDIESVFVMREWKETDEVTLDAYDASGVAGVKWWVANESASLSVAPTQTRGDTKKGSWISVQVRDRAGNASTPFHLPLPGGTVPGLGPDAKDTASIGTGPGKQGG